MVKEVNIYSKEQTDNIVSNIVSDVDERKQDTLVSGVNIKTINNKSVLGSGNIDIQGGSSGAAWGDITGNINEQADLIDKFDAKQNILVSGTNIKTINNESLLGSGNIVIQGGSSGAVWGSITGDISNQTDLTTALTALITTKQDKLTSGTNIKTINNQSILGSGNIDIQGGSSGAVWGSITGTLGMQTDLVQSLNSKQNTLISGTNIKTINNQSILGSGNIEIQGSSSSSVSKTIVSIYDTTQLAIHFYQMNIGDYLIGGYIDFGFGELHNFKMTKITDNYLLIAGLFTPSSAADIYLSTAYLSVNTMGYWTFEFVDSAGSGYSLNVTSIDSSDITLIYLNAVPF